MARRWRIRRVLKWTGLSACLLVAAVWVFSAFWRISRIGSTYWVDLILGRVVIEHQAGSEVRWFRVGRYYLAPTETRVFRVRPELIPGPRAGLGLVLPHYERLYVTPPEARVIHRRLLVPLWLPLAVLAIPTAILWWLDRRSRSPGHCRKCGYNLTGNVSGRCPECGTMVIPADGRR
jgi:hypothetical protein